MMRSDNHNKSEDDDHDDGGGHDAATFARDGDEEP